MKRVIRPLGASCAAALAVFAICAQPSMAKDFELAADTTFVTAGGSNHHFTVTGGTTTCHDVSFKGHIDASTVTSITVTPIYTSCTAFGFIGATVTGFGHHGEEKTCDYVVHANGTGDLACDEGAEVTIHSGPCVAHIPGQAGLGSITFNNVSNGDIEVSFHITDITVSHTDGLFCASFSGSGEGKNGSLTGSSVVSGEKADTTPVDISWNGTD